MTYYCIPEGIFVLTVLNDQGPIDEVYATEDELEARIDSLMYTDTLVWLNTMPGGPYML